MHGCLAEKYINKTENPEAPIKPSIGDATINIRTFSTPAITIAFIPPAISADIPTRPANQSIAT